MKFKEALNSLADWKPGDEVEVKDSGEGRNIFPPGMKGELITVDAKAEPGKLNTRVKFKIKQGHRGFITYFSSDHLINLSVKKRKLETIKEL